jgi:hypothetical protein
MATLAELRSALRVLLNDIAAEGYLWSDGNLNHYLNDAIRAYSRSFPRQRETIVITVAGQREYELPAELTSVQKVEIVRAEDRVPLLAGDDRTGACYELYGGKLIVFPTPSESGLSIAVRYLAPHAPLALDGDLSTVPDADIDLLLNYAGSMVLQSLLAEKAKRGRFESRSGQPANAVANLYWEQYERGIRLRKARVRAGKLIAGD